jgi:hypothetical protein
MVKAHWYSELKEAEAASRLRVMRSRGTRNAAKIQRRVSLAGGGDKWRITNWRQVARAMEKCA